MYVIQILIGCQKLNHLRRKIFHIFQTINIAYADNPINEHISYLPFVNSSLRENKKNKQNIFLQFFDFVTIKILKL